MQLRTTAPATTNLASVSTIAAAMQRNTAAAPVTDESKPLQPYTRPERYSLHIRLLKFSLQFVMSGDLNEYVADIRSFLYELEKRNGWQL
jgi:hypothetical protein